MKREDIKLLKLKKKLIYLKKNEIKSNLLKSIIQNNKVLNIYKSYAGLLLNKRKLNMYKFKHVCLKNHKNSSVYNNSFLSKYGVKNLLINNKMQNIKINS
jgi:hypothetical protein